MVVHSSASGGGGPDLGAHAGGSVLGLYDEERARAVKRRIVLGAQAIRSSGASVPRPRKDALSNEKLAPVESGRGFALLEKMGWKKGQGLGRSNDGVMLPVERHGAKGPPDSATATATALPPRMPRDARVQLWLRAAPRSPSGGAPNPSCADPS
eukprot:scaffold92938_cov21-Phaeocystis_antarctica.AAC.1